MNSRTPSELPKPQTFDYSSLDPKSRTLVQQRTSELKRLILRSAKDTLAIGQNLVEVREQLGYGNFRKWLKAEFAWSHQAATRFIQVAERFSCLNLRQVEIAASALYLLARPSTPEEARQEALERAFQGETITHALAMQIRSHHTIDVEAEVVEDDEESPAPVQPPSVPEPQSQSEPVNEPLPQPTEPETQPEILTDATPRPAESDQAPEKLESSAQNKPVPVNDFKVGDRIHIEGSQNKHYNGKTANVVRVNSRHKTLTVLVDGAPPWNTVSLPMQHCARIEGQSKPLEATPGIPDQRHPTVPPERYEVGDRSRILRRQHGEDNWTGETARIWEITSDGCLRVDVEGHPAVRFTLKSQWMERMLEEVDEQSDDQPEQLLDEGWADEPDPETPAIAKGSSESEAPLQLEAGDRLQVTNLGKQNQKWTGEVTEVLEVTETEIMVAVRVPRQPL